MLCLFTDYLSAEMDGFCIVDTDTFQHLSLFNAPVVIYEIRKVHLCKDLYH